MKLKYRRDDFILIIGFEVQYGIEMLINDLESIPDLNKITRELLIMLQALKGIQDLPRES